MKIGVPKEIKSNEHRVGMTPSAARAYVDAGHHVMIQKGAGVGIGASDDDYASAGAEIADDAGTIFAAADMIVKVKEPQMTECAQLRPQQILFTYLHLAPDQSQTDALLQSGCAAVAYETVTSTDGSLPLLAPMSEVAGRLSIQAAARCLEMIQGGRGVLLGGVPGVPPAKVVVIGGGTVGTHAARMAVGLGADVTILDRSLPRLRELDELFDGRVTTRFADSVAIHDLLHDADVFIGAVLIPGATAPRLITREMLKAMKPGSCLVDVAIDQGGCFETSRPTTHDDPVFIVDGVIHYCVANMPGAVPRTSSFALGNATLPFGLALANKGLEALRENPHLRDGLNVISGKVTNRGVAEAHQYQLHDALAVLGG